MVIGDEIKAFTSSIKRQIWVAYWMIRKFGRGERKWRLLERCLAMDLELVAAHNSYSLASDLRHYEKRLEELSEEAFKFSDAIYDRYGRPDISAMPEVDETLMDLRMCLRTHREDRRRRGPLFGSLGPDCLTSSPGEGYSDAV